MSIQCSFDHLPPEIKIHIISFLELQYFGIVASVCKEWRELVYEHDKLVWKPKYMQDFGGQVPLHQLDSQTWRAKFHFVLNQYRQLNGDFTNILFWASENGHLSLLRKLIGNSVDKLSPSLIYRLLLRAVFRGQTNMVEFLLPYYTADINVRPPFDRRPLLCIVAQSGYVDMVELLIRYGARIDVVDCHNRTPLYLAAEAGATAVVETLIRHGATMDEDPTQTALFIAGKNGHTTTAAVLKKAFPDAKEYSVMLPQRRNTIAVAPPPPLRQSALYS